MSAPSVAGNVWGTGGRPTFWAGRPRSLETESSTRRCDVAATPILLDYVESAVIDFWEMPAGEYDPVSQMFRYNQPVMAGTTKSQSYQNSTSGLNVITGYEDYDEQV